MAGTAPARVSWISAAMFAVGASAEPPPPPPLAYLCFNPKVVVIDLDVALDEQEMREFTVREVFVKPDLDGGLPGEATLQPGDALLALSTCSQEGVTPTVRALATFEPGGTCDGLYAIDEDGVLEDGKPDTLTVEEAIDAAFSDDCTGALSEAGYTEAPYQDPLLQRLFGCSSAGQITTYAGAPALLLLALRRAARARR